MSESFDPSRSLTALEQDSTVIAVIEMSQAKWLVAAVIPGVARQPLKKLDADEEALLKLLHRWRNEASRAGREIKRIVVAYEAGRDGFWLARWLRTREVEAYVIHPTSVAVSREHRRAKTDRLDTELLKRAFLGWLRGERRHCSMVAIPTLMLGLLGWPALAVAHEAKHQQHEGRLPTIAAAPDFALISQDGAEVTLAALRGKVVALTFIYASCPDVCPMLTDKLARVQGRAGVGFRQQDRVRLDHDRSRAGYARGAERVRGGI
jgi:hypothetical protein